MLSKLDIRQILKPKKQNITPSDDFRIINSWAEYDDKNATAIEKRKLNYLCFELETIDPATGEQTHYYKALKFARVIRLPKSAKESTSLMDMQSQVLAACGEVGINLTVIIANLITTNPPIGLLYLYGVQGIAEDIEVAKKKADRDYISLTTSLQATYGVLELVGINAQEGEWLREKMYAMDYITVVRGIPKAHREGADGGNKGIGGKNVNPASQETLEEIIRGMADYEYVIQILSTPVYTATLKAWLAQSEKDMTIWQSQMQGTKSLSFNISMPMVYGANRSNSSGWNRATSDGTTYSSSESSAFGTSYGESLSQGMSKSFGESFSQSVGSNISQSSSTSHSVGTNMGFSNTLGESLGTSLGKSVSVSESVGTSESVSSGQSVNFSQSENIGHSFGISQGESYGFGQGQSSSLSNSVSYSESAGWTRSAGWSEGSSQGGSESVGENSGYNISLNHTVSENDSASLSDSDTTTNGGNGSGSIFGISGGFNHSNGTTTAEGIVAAAGEGDSLNISANAAYTKTDTESWQATQSRTESASSTGSTSNSFGQTATNGQSINQSWGVNQGTSESQSIGNSISNGWGESIGYSQGVTTGSSFSNGQTLGQSQTASSSSGQSYGNSESYSVSSGTTVSTSKTQTSGQSYSTGTSETAGTSQGLSQTRSTGQSTAVSNSLSSGTSGTIATGLSTSIGLGPSIGYNKSYQWIDQSVKDIVELLDYQNKRIKESLRGNGAFYTYVYIACPSMDALAAAQAIAKTTWNNETALVQPLQVLDLTTEEQQHLLYHFSAFSSDVTRENVSGVEEYRYCTVLLPSEFVAYTHLPRISEGGVYSDVGDIPKFAVPSMLKGEIYMGKIVSPERHTMRNGYITPFDYRIDESELMHGIFTGASRSGKTVAAMRFVAELAQVKRKKTGKRMRIVCMDPKHDWRGLARFVEPERFRFYSLGNKYFHPIKINPCKIPRGVIPQVWIDGMIDIYCRAYGLLERGKQLMGETIYSLYEDAGVFEACNHSDWKERVPELSSKVTFAAVAAKMEQIKASLENPDSKKGRAGNDTRDAYARLLDRLQAFTRPYSVEHQLFGTSEGIGIDEMIGDDDVTVLESEGLENTFQNFIFGIITSGFYKWAKAQEGGFLAPNQYETLLVIEEANQVLTGNDCAGTGGGSSFGMTGQSEFEQILDQSAGYGLYVMAITQKIADMPKSVIANSGLCFAGRLKTQDDISVVVRTIGREERVDDRDVVKWFPRCQTGWFVCQSSRTFSFKDAEPVLVQIAMINSTTPSNAEIDEILANKEAREKLKIA